MHVKKAYMAVVADRIQVKLILKNGQAIRFAISEKSANELTARWLARDTPSLSRLMNFAKGRLA